MADTPSKQLIQECAACGSLIDVSEEEPLALMHCPTCGGAMRVRSQFGHFQLRQVLGAGGMGSVYRAQDQTLNRSVALKLLRREYLENPEFIRQFEHEAALTALINHPNVVKVYSSGSDNGLFYIAMELVDQGSLDELMTLQKKLKEPQVLEVGIQIAQGLRAAFQRGLIHRDVKPGNILFAEAHHAKIVDFGLAAPIESSGGVDGEVWGTPYYVAPEKLEHPPLEDFRSDIYSLGATLFHALAGRPPHEAEDASIPALRELKSTPVSLQNFAPQVSSSTAFVINRSLAKDPAQRYASYDAFIEHLEYARSELLAKGTTPRPPSAPVPASRKPRRRVAEDAGQQWVMSILTLITLLAIFAGGVYIYQHRSQIFPDKPKPHSAEADKARQAAAAVRPRYDAARTLFLAGKSEEAAAAFRDLLNSAELPQPLLDWATLHAGLAQLMAGKLDEAQADFEKLSKYGPFSRDPFDQEFAGFMTKVGEKMQGETVLPGSEASDFNSVNYQAIALLVFGLKDWELGEFDQAQEWFRQFEAAAPEEPDDWIAQYQKFPAKVTESIEKIQKFSEHAKLADDPERAKAELPRLKEELASLNLTGTMLRKGTTIIRKVQQAVDDHEAEVKKVMTGIEDADAATLADAKAKADALAAGLNFKGALTLAKGISAVTDKGKADKAALLRRYQWLAIFKSTLSQDLSTYGYARGLQRKAGPVVPGTVSDADETNLVVKFPNGSTTIPWTAASFEGLYVMGRAFLRADLPADRLAEREWALGAFCEFSGRLNEATVMFREAAKNKPAYAEEWKLFPNVPR